MRGSGTGSKALLLGSALLFSCPLLIDTAQADQNGRPGSGELKPTVAMHGQVIAGRVNFARGVHVSKAMYLGARSNAIRNQGISCVPYARQVSGIQVVGNAWEWWRNAAGVYARGDQPEVGSVLNFRSNGRMRLGHVAVVTQVVNPREVIVDHANWPSGGGRSGISRGVAVVDVSEANNWSAVRVELGRSSGFGSIYPTYGFIYNRADTGTVLASVQRPAPQPSINPVPSDLRPVAERPWRTTEEVAEAPAARRRIDPTVDSQAGRFGQ
jgi:surface antigen